AILVQDAAQPQRGRQSPDVGRLQSDQAADAAAATEAAPPIPGVASTRSAVNQRPKSVVREICTPRSVGTGDGQPSPVTRWKLLGKPAGNTSSCVARARLAIGTTAELGKLPMARPVAEIEALIQGAVLIPRGSLVAQVSA